MCTSIILKTINGDWVAGRSNEFISKYKSALSFIPRGYDHTNTFLTDKINFTFKNKYSYLGLNIEGIIPIKDLMEDGINEKGLSVSFLYFPYHDYKELELKDVTERNINYVFLTSYILGNFDSVKDVRDNMKDLNERIYWEKNISTLGLGIHITIVDNSGDRIVIEPMNKKLVLKENPIGVLTNSSPLEFHYENLRKYSYLSSKERTTDYLYNGLKEHKLLTHGTGLLGLPGDFTADSRFVRAAVFSSLVDESESIIETVRKTFQILNTVDIPGGLIVDDDEEKIKKVKKIYSEPMISSLKYKGALLDYTDNFIVKDLLGLKLYYKTHDNISPRFIDLSKLKDGKTKKTIYINKDNAKEFTEVYFK